MKDRLDKFETSITDNGKLLIRSPVGAFDQREVNPPDVDNPIIVNGAWNLDSYPNQIVAELQDGRLVMFSINPFRPLREKDLREYKSYHPRKCKGRPLPGYLYKFYGLAKNDETASEVVRCRLSPSEKNKLEEAAQAAGKNISEFIRNWVRLLSVTPRL